MPSGWKHEIVTYTGNNTNDRTIPTSFALDTGAVIVWIHNSENTDRAAYVRTSAMPAGSSQENGDASLNTNQINTFTASGFTIDAGVNVLNIPYLAIVLRDTTGNYLKVGSYVGDGLDNRNIDVDGGSAWAPEVVWTFYTFHAYRLSGFAGAAQSQRPDNVPGPIGAEGIQDMTATGFQVGTANDVNQSGNTIYYAVLKGLTAPNFAHFTATGVTAPYELTGLGFGAVPGFVLGKRHGSATARWRGATTHTGVISQLYSGLHNTTQGVTAVGVDAATFGSNISSLGVTLSGWAWSSLSEPDTLQFFTYGAISL